MRWKWLLVAGCVVVLVAEVLAWRWWPDGAVPFLGCGFHDKANDERIGIREENSYG
ncbi:MAG: hypothetical protein ACRDRU_06640 [Pseudonocardiaceae bacterium]